MFAVSWFHTVITFRIGVNMVEWEADEVQIWLHCSAFSWLFWKRFRPFSGGLNIGKVESRFRGNALIDFWLGWWKSVNCFKEHFYSGIFLSFASVSFMKERLDQDSMGIILLHNFLKEFFPGEVCVSIESIYCIWTFYTVTLHAHIILPNVYFLGSN